MKRAIHIKKTEKEFRRVKRAQLKKLMVAREEFRKGMAYLPLDAYGKMHKAFDEIDDAHKLLIPWWKGR